MKKTNSQITQLVRRVLSENISGSLKFGMKDSAGSTKIRDLQKALQIKSPKTGKPISTGYFGDMTVSALLSRVPDLYKGKNDVIDDNKYLKIIEKLKTLPPPKPQPVPGGGTTANVIKSINFGSLWQNFPKNSSASQIFPIIFPTAYNKFPDSFANACATRLSLALNNVGVKPPAQFKTENPLNWGSVVYKKGIPITVRAKDTPGYLKSVFGAPSFKGENTMENINKHLKGKKGIFTITNVPGWSATGHADIFFNDRNGFTCGHGCYFGAGGIIQAWFVG